MTAFQGSAAAERSDALAAAARKVPPYNYDTYIIKFIREEPHFWRPGRASLLASDALAAAARKVTARDLVNSTKHSDKG